MHRFLVPPNMISEHTVTFPAQEWKHLKQVLRLQPGDEVVVFDGQGNGYLTVLQEGNGIIKSELPSKNEPPLRIHLAQGLAKGDKMDFIIQKAVELGVHSIIPLSTEHTVVKVSADDTKKQERWQRISEEACKQCGRDLVPVVSKVNTFRQLIAKWSNQPAGFFYEAAAGTDTRLKPKLAEWQGQAVKDLLMVVGPEGGFSREEAGQASEAGWSICSLGPRILRTETASLTALSIIMYELGDLG